jgi:hypothetical protein
VIPEGAITIINKKLKLKFIFLVAKLTSNYILRLAMDKHAILFFNRPVQEWKNPLKNGTLAVL